MKKPRGPAAQSRCLTPGQCRSRKDSECSRCRVERGLERGLVGGPPRPVTARGCVSVPHSGLDLVAAGLTGLPTSDDLSGARSTVVARKRARGMFAALRSQVGSGADLDGIFMVSTSGRHD